MYALICVLASVVTHSKPTSLNDILAWSSNSVNPSFSAIGEEEHCAVSLVRLCVTRPVAYVCKEKDKQHIARYILSSCRKTEECSINY